MSVISLLKKDFNNFQNEAYMFGLVQHNNEEATNKINLVQKPTRLFWQLILSEIARY